MPCLIYLVCFKVHFLAVHMLGSLEQPPFKYLKFLNYQCNILGIGPVKIACRIQQLFPVGHCMEIPFEPRHEKTNVLVSYLVRHKPGCTATEDD